MHSIPIYRSHPALLYRLAKQIKRRSYPIRKAIGMISPQLDLSSDLLTPAQNVICKPRLDDLGAPIGQDIHVVKNVPDAFKVLRGANRDGTYHCLRLGGSQSG